MIATDISWGAAASALIGQQQLFKQEQVMNSKLIPFGWNYFLALACPSPGALYALYVALLIADMDGFVQECSDFQSTLWERFCFRITAISASVHWKLSTWAKTVWRGLWGGRSSCEGLFFPYWMSWFSRTPAKWFIPLLAFIFSISDHNNTNFQPSNVDVPLYNLLQLHCFFGVVSACL